MAGGSELKPWWNCSVCEGCQTALPPHQPQQLTPAPHQHLEWRSASGALQLESAKSEPKHRMMQTGDKRERRKFWRVQMWYVAGKNSLQMPSLSPVLVHVFAQGWHLLSVLSGQSGAANCCK